MIFLIGGARSGKSSLAATLAAEIGAPVRYVATARADDEEMAARIEVHRRDRPRDWEVVDAPIEVVGAVRSTAADRTLIVDCLTLWLSNLMVERSDEIIMEMVDAALVAIGGHGGETIVVSNEVGAGLVPMHPVGRRFRDLQGRANQRFAAEADRALLVVAGRTLRLEDPGA